MNLFASPEINAGCACYDHFQDEAEDYWGLAVEEDFPSAFALLEHLSSKLPHGIETQVAWTDGSNELVLLIHKKYWRRKDVKDAWAEVIATPLEKLIAEANLHDDVLAIERVSDNWSNEGISERIGEMIVMRKKGLIDSDDLSVAILDEPPDYIVKGIISHQIKYMLDG